MKPVAESRSGRYFLVKGRRIIRQSFRPEFFAEVRALRRDLIRLGTHYVRKPGLWLAIGLVGWVAYVLILVLLGASFSDAIETALEITFAISAPRDAVARTLAANPQSLSSFGQMAAIAGWVVIIAFVLLIPAVVALMLERLPNLVATVRGLMPTEAWEFFEMYTKLLSRYLSAVAESVVLADGDVPTASAIRATRDVFLKTIADLVTFWYRGEIELHANISFLRLVPGTSATTPDSVPLYAHSPARERASVLELVGWANPQSDLPTSLLLDVDEAQPRPGAPFAAVTHQHDVISNALDRTEWRLRGLSDSQIDETLDYFRSVPFRGFFSIPVIDEWDEEKPVLGVLSVQVDRASVFLRGKDDTEDLVELVRRLCYFLAWLERTDRNAH